MLLQSQKGNPTSQTSKSTTTTAPHTRSDNSNRRELLLLYDDVGFLALIFQSIRPGVSRYIQNLNIQNYLFIFNFFLYIFLSLFFVVSPILLCCYYVTFSRMVGYRLVTKYYSKKKNRNNVRLVNLIECWLNEHKTRVTNCCYVV